MESVTSAIISFFYPITFPNKLTNPEWYMRASLGIPDASLLPMAAWSMKGVLGALIKEIRRRQ